MQPIVRTAKARIRGFGSCESCKNENKKSFKGDRSMLYQCQKHDRKQHQERERERATPFCKTF